jgi:2-C-methyl-D-erythritol 4-phosphate cytidylyltransferase
MSELGMPLYFSKGSHSNIKITTKEDIDLFLGYLLAKKYNEEHKQQ